MRIPLAFLVFLASIALSAQQDTSWVTYRGGMDLREGIYRDFRSFRLNAPNIPLDKLRDDQGLPVNDIRQSLSKLYFHPDTGERKRVNVDRIWGFCHNDVVYVSAGNGFYRIGLMGGLAHMAFEQSYRDWDPYLYGYGTVTRTVLLQQLIDMETGATLPFNASGMDAGLVHDPVLLEEFRNLPKKQRNRDETLFRFLRMYNERHPLLLPE